jgi:hypothetical protein
MEDNSLVATPEKAWLQRLNQLKRSVVNLFYCFFYQDLLLVFSDDSNDGNFLPK